jgi:hypothetical protein
LPFLVAFIAIVVITGIWLFVTNSPAADYVPLILVFLSAVAAIAGKSWDDNRTGLSRLTVKGRFLAALAVFGLIIGLRNTQLTQAKLKEAGKIQSIAYHQVMEGVSMILFPITSSWRDPPKSDLDILARAQDTKTIEFLDKTRIVPFADPVRDAMMMIGDPRMFSLTANGARIASSCGYPHRGFRALYELFDFCVDGGEAKVKESEQLFISNLDPETVRLLQDILEDDFYVSHYKNLSQHDDLYYQGIYDEAGGTNRSMSADRTWRAMLEVQRTLLPKKDHASSQDRKEQTSQWLYLGTYYFGPGSDSTGYRSFLQKVTALVKHVDGLTNSTKTIDTF